MIKQQDLYLLLGITVLLGPFFTIDIFYDAYISLNIEHGFIAAFCQFAILSSVGELIGLRISRGAYIHKNYGILPRAIVYGCLGITINAAFIIFSSGVPALLAYSGLPNASAILAGDLSEQKVFVAFSISTLTNLIYAPLMMTVYKLADMHITNRGGAISSLYTSINIGELMSSLDWHTQWHVVFKKTIPLFWIPAHTITFLLPAEMRVLFAAMLGVALGVVMAVTSRNFPAAHLYGSK